MFITFPSKASLFVATWGHHQGTYAGSASKAWYNPGTKVQSFGLKCNHALDFAKRNSPEAHRRYDATVVYLDVHTCVPPWHQLDGEASQPLSAMALAKVKYDTALFQFERDTHDGPLFGEGANHFYWAGRVDGVEAQVADGEDHAPLLDFDLLKLHPQMINHGMGYYERWFRRGYDAAWGADAGSVEHSTNTVRRNSPTATPASSGMRLSGTSSTSGANTT